VVRSASRSSSTPTEGGVLSQEIKFSPNTTAEPREAEEPLSFWEQLYEVPEDQWSSGQEKGYRVYLYEGHAGSTGPYIALITQPFDIEWVKQNFGGGAYRAQLNNPGGKIAASVRFTIEGESKRKPPQNAQSAAAPAQGDSFQSELIRMIREEQQETRNLFRQILSGDRGNVAPQPAAAVDPTTLFRGMVDMFKEFMPQTKPMDLLETVALLDKLRGPDLLATLKAAKEAGIIPAAGGSADLVTQFKQLKEAADVIGLGEGKGRSWADTLIEKGPEILDAGGKIVDRLRAVEETRLATARTVQDIQRRGAAVVTPPPGGPHQPPSAPPQHQYAAPQIQPPAPGATGLDVEAPSPAAQAALSQAEQQEVFVMTKVVEAIANGDTGQQIVDFLDMIDPAICTSFEGATVEQIAGYFSSHPILRKATALPRFRAALTEIVEVLNAPDQDLTEQKPN
jgi:hypothetical protein